MFGIVLLLLLFLEFKAFHHYNISFCIPWQKTFNILSPIAFIS